MKKTFTATMPDKVGVFLVAEEIFTSLQLCITRLSYNKAVDSHTLFIEVEGEEYNIALAAEKLHELGYLLENKRAGNVILFDFCLQNTCGALKPLLALINSYNFNISYMSSQESDTAYQHLRMGLLIENDTDISAFIKHAVTICDVKTINYNETGLPLDNTVFYMTFANKISKQNNLGEKAKQNLLVDTNIILEALTKKNFPPHTVFEYIGKFAENLIAFQGDAFKARVSFHTVHENIRIYLIEPPCGSNICVMETPSEILTIDSGFACYKEEALRLIKDAFPHFDTKPKHLLLTHADIDHVGIVSPYDRIYVSQTSYDNFVCEHEGMPNIREQSAPHAPYVRISKTLSHYTPPPLDKMCIIGHASTAIEQNLTEKIGELSFDGVHFHVYQGLGGHLAGETLFIERTHRLIFTGDIVVNIKGFTQEQEAFNKLAPYLVSAVDSDPQLAAEERKAIMALLEPGQWLLIGGHGAPMSLDLV